MSRQRLDYLLVSAGFAETRSKARALIMAGGVTVGGKIITKSGSLVQEDSVIEVYQKPCYVSRGGIKLAHALDEFGIDVDSLTVMDVGASTGGFTDCLIQRGAKKVYSVDVGYGQIAYKLRQDTRVVVMDRTNARYAFSLPEKVALVVVDLSFRSEEAGSAGFSVCSSFDSVFLSRAFLFFSSTSISRVAAKLVWLFSLAFSRCPAASSSLPVPARRP